MDYKTVAHPALAELVEKRSRFISRIVPVATQAAALAFLASLRKQHWDATHHVYAYKLREENITRSSDDGEPQGTSGAPTLEAVESAELTDVMLVTTRYFGGTLLGGGGLVRAYSQSARLCIEAAEIQIMRLCTRYQITLDYGAYSRIASVLSEFGAVTLQSDFTDSVSLTVLVGQAQGEAFVKAVTEATLGKALLREDGVQYRAEK